MGLTEWKSKEFRSREYFLMVEKDMTLISKRKFSTVERVLTLDKVAIRCVIEKGKDKKRMKKERNPAK